MCIEDCWGACSGEAHEHTCKQTHHVPKNAKGLLLFVPFVLCKGAIYELLPGVDVPANTNNGLLALVYV